VRRRIHCGQRIQPLQWLPAAWTARLLQLDTALLAATLFASRVGGGWAVNVAVTRALAWLAA